MDDESDLPQALAFTQRAYEALSRVLEAERREAERQIAAARAEVGAIRAAHDEALSVVEGLTRLAAGHQAAIAAIWTRRPMRWFRGRRRAKRGIIAASPYFDAAWYLQQYPDVAAAGQDAARHYAFFGAAEGRDPGPGFSTLGYLTANPDVAAAGVNPLSHYEQHGRDEGRATSPPTIRAAQTPKKDIVFVSGEPGSPGHIYRIRRPAEAAIAAGLNCLAITVAEACSDSTKLNASIVIIWRAAWTEPVATVFAAARRFGARIVFDVDDLMFDPDLAKLVFIDGIRTQSLTEQVVSDFYAAIQKTLLAADACLSPTAFLTQQMMRFGKAGFVLPNGFDETTRRVSSAALAARRQAGEAKLQRIGYAGGTRTHQKDFATIAAPIAAVLRQAAHRRLVLFRRAGVPCVDIDEFPELAELAPQIEWREMVGLDELPWELVRFDVNLAPLEVGNPYCEAKSELKFFEAALVGVPTVASPTQPFRDAMRHGETGFVASTPETWFAHITALLSDEALRQRVVQAALVDVEARYGVAKRVETLVEMMQHLS